MADFIGRISGVDELKSYLKKATGLTQKMGSQAIDRLLWAIWNTAIDNCPVRTGKLVSSIRMAKESGDKGFVVAGGGWESDTYYAPYVEFGTVKNRPNPFMQRTADEFKSASRTMAVIGPKRLFEGVMG